MISLLLSQLTLLYLDAHFFYSYKLFLDGISILFVRISNALLITVGESVVSMVLTETPDYSDRILKYNCNFSGQGRPHWG